MKLELNGKKTAVSMLAAAAMGVSLAPSAWAAADDYTPLGIKNGPFTIFLNGSVGMEYNDNIFALPDGDIDAVNNLGLDEDDFAAHINFGTEARGKFSGGSTLDLYASGTYGAFFEYDNSNFFDAKVGLRSRTFFTKAVSLRAKSEYSYEHEGFGLLDTIDSLPVPATKQDVERFLTGTEPVTLNKLTGSLALDIKPGRTGFSIGTNAVGRFYNDRDIPTTPSSSVSLDNRNYWDVNVFAEFSQDIDETTGFFLRLGGNGRAYPDRTLVAATAGGPGVPERDSVGLNAVAGARIKATGTINAEAYAGYVNQSFDNSDFDDISDFIFGGNMRWTPSAFFEMKVRADRSVHETNDSTNSSYIGTKAETTLSVFPLENLTFWTTGRYVNRDYKLADNVFTQPLNEREDDIWFGEIGGEFKINRNIGLGLHYNYYQRESSISNDASYTIGDIDFDRQKVMFEVNLAR